MTETTKQSLPSDTHLAYTVSHEAWYARHPGIVDQPQIMVAASAQGSGGGVAWEFSVTEHNFDRTHPISVRLFDDAFAALTQIPEFFAALVAEKIDSLDGVRSVLDRMGAVDETDRRDRTTGQDVTPASTLRQAIRSAAVASYADDGGRRVLVIPENAVPGIAESVLGND